MKRILPALLLILPACTGDDDGADDAAGTGTASGSTSDATAGSGTGSNATSFSVTITNISTPLTTGGGPVDQPFAPGVWVVHSAGEPLFTNGSADRGDGLEALAEDGMPATLAGNVASNPISRSTAMFNTPDGSSDPGPIGPGAAYSFNVVAQPGDFLSFATMYVQSNDLFVAPAAAGIALFDSGNTALSGDISDRFMLWDAGTEINEAPGEGPNQAPRQTNPNMGPPENGVVAPVSDGFTYPAVTELLTVTIAAN